MPKVYLSLGSNRGDSPAILRAAVEALRGLLGGLRASNLYLSDPMYLRDQPAFLNLAVTGDCLLAPLELLDAIQGIEARFGRDRSRERSKGPRSLDIDILLYGDLVIDSDRLVLPHPRMAERKFALLPLLELEGGLVWPGGGGSLSDSLDALAPQGIYYWSLARYSLCQSR
jgi:2-amino-4-hydroxy-6-hydroxymethyldihydropteridine diphosphokinase